MAIAIATVANSIQSLTVVGLTIYDVDNIPAAVDVRQTAALVPIENYVTDMTVTRDSFGGPVAKMTLTYNLHYFLYFKEWGAGRAGALEYYDGTIDMIAAIWDAVLDIYILNGAVDILPAGISSIGMVIDPAGNQFRGCELIFAVTEFIN
jgi:hypothetical protein